MKVLDKCRDFKALKNKFSNDILEKIDDVLNEYENGKISIKNEYTNTFRKQCVIDWYESLMSTKDFVKEIKEFN